MPRAFNTSYALKVLCDLFSLTCKQYQVLKCQPLQKTYDNLSFDAYPSRTSAPIEESHCSMALYQCKQHKQTNSQTQVGKIIFVGEVI